MRKTIPSRVCGSVTEVRAGAEAAGNGRWHWGWGLWSLGLQGRGVREAMGAFGLKEFSVQLVGMYCSAKYSTGQE